MSVTMMRQSRAAAEIRDYAEIGAMSGHYAASATRDVDMRESASER